MELILNDEEIKKIIQKHFSGVESVELTNKDNKIKAIINISEQGALLVAKKNTNQKIPDVKTPNTKDVKIDKTNVTTMGSGNERVFGARF